MESASPARAPYGWRSGLTFARGGELASAAAAALLALGSAALVLKLWRASLSVPFEYSHDDANYQLMLAKGVIDHGWWLSNPSLGAPFGQHLQDFAVGGDSLHLLLLKALGAFSSDPAVVANLFYVLSFPLCALSAYWVLRWARAGRTSAIVCAVLFALVPYHFIRGEHHAFLSAYYAVPAGCYLALAVAGGRPLFGVRSAGGRRARFLSCRSLITVVSCVAVAGTGNVYYPAFTLLLIAGVMVGRAAVSRRAQPAVEGAVVMVLIVAVLAIELAPTFVHALDHGRNFAVAVRQAAETEVGSLKLAQLVLPVTHHRIAALARLAAHYAASGTPPGPGEPYGASLGLVGTVGLAWLLGVLVVRALGAARRQREERLVGETAVLALIAFLIGTIGGISTLISYLISPQLRAWNRISIFIAFLALAGFAYLLDVAGRRLGATPVGRAGFAAVLTATLVFGAWDQTVAPFAPSYSALAAQYRGDARFVAAIERRLPRGAEVFQLPYMPFPEAQRVHGMVDYDPLRGYLHSSRLRWSYGAMKGRPADWAQAQDGLPLAAVLPAVAAAGFDGLWVDRAGYPQRARALDAALRARLRQRPLVSPDGRLLFFDLRAYRRQLASRLPAAQLRALRTVTLQPARIEDVHGLSAAAERGASGDVSWWVTSRHATLALVDPSAGDRRVTFVATLRAGAGRPGTIRVAYPDGAAALVPATRRGVSVEHSLTLHPGRNDMVLVTTGPRIRAPWDPRTLYVQVLDPRVIGGPFGGLETRCLRGAHRPRACTPTT